METETGRLAVAKINEFLRHLEARDLPDRDLQLLKAEAFEACAARSRELGDERLARAEEDAAGKAREMAAR